ncbi:pNP1450L [African swine fever virus]|uniref:PNP1450L n=1 Tax=African swine fever virus TaxID=10497 RepID=A0A8A1UIH9_ASF|nr:pNP1450L [African swine fever virus]
MYHINHGINTFIFFRIIFFIHIVVRVHGPYARNRAHMGTRGNTVYGIHGGVNRSIRQDLDWRRQGHSQQHVGRLSCIMPCLFYRGILSRSCHAICVHVYMSMVGTLVPHIRSIFTVIFLPCRFYAVQLHGVSYGGRHDGVWVDVIIKHCAKNICPVCFVGVHIIYSYQLSLGIHTVAHMLINIRIFVAWYSSICAIYYFIHHIYGDFFIRTHSGIGTASTGAFPYVYANIVGNTCGRVFHRMHVVRVGVFTSYTIIITFYTIAFYYHGCFVYFQADTPVCNIFRGLYYRMVFQKIRHPFHITCKIGVHHIFFCACIRFVQYMPLYYQPFKCYMLYAVTNFLRICFICFHFRVLYTYKHFRGLFSLYGLRTTDLLGPHNSRLVGSPSHGPVVGVQHVLCQGLCYGLRRQDSHCLTVLITTLCILYPYVVQDGTHLLAGVVYCFIGCQFDANMHAHQRGSAFTIYGYGRLYPFLYVVIIHVWKIFAKRFVHRVFLYNTFFVEGKHASGGAQYNVFYDAGHVYRHLSIICMQLSAITIFDVYEDLSIFISILFMACKFFFKQGRLYPGVLVFVFKFLVRQHVGFKPYGFKLARIKAVLSVQLLHKTRIDGNPSVLFHNTGLQAKDGFTVGIPCTCCRYCFVVQVESSIHFPKDIFRGGMARNIPVADVPVRLRLQGKPGVLHQGPAEGKLGLYALCIIFNLADARHVVYHIGVCALGASGHHLQKPIGFRIIGIHIRLYNPIGKFMRIQLQFFVQVMRCQAYTRHVVSMQQPVVYFLRLKQQFIVIFLDLLLRLRGYEHVGRGHCVSGVAHILQGELLGRKYHFQGLLRPIPTRNMVLHSTGGARSDGLFVKDAFNVFTVAYLCTDVLLVILHVRRIHFCVPCGGSLLFVGGLPQYHTYNRFAIQQVSWGVLTKTRWVSLGCLQQPHTVQFVHHIFPHGGVRACMQKASHCGVLYLPIIGTRTFCGNIPVSHRTKYFGLNAAHVAPGNPEIHLFPIKVRIIPGTCAVIHLQRTNFWVFKNDNPVYPYAASFERRLAITKRDVAGINVTVQDVSYLQSTVLFVALNVVYGLCYLFIHSCTTRVLALSIYKIRHYSIIIILLHCFRDLQRSCKGNGIPNLVQVQVCVPADGGPAVRPYLAAQYGFTNSSLLARKSSHVGGSRTSPHVDPTLSCASLGCGGGNGIQQKVILQLLYGLQIAVNIYRYFLAAHDLEVLRDQQILSNQILYHVIIVVQALGACPDSQSVARSYAVGGDLYGLMHKFFGMGVFTSPQFYNGVVRYARKDLSVILRVQFVNLALLFYPKGTIFFRVLIIFGVYCLTDVPLLSFGLACSRFNTTLTPIMVLVPLYVNDGSPAVVAYIPYPSSYFGDAERLQHRSMHLQYPRVSHTLLALVCASVAFILLFGGSHSRIIHAPLGGKGALKYIGNGILHIALPLMFIVTGNIVLYGSYFGISSL